MPDLIVLVHDDGTDCTHHGTPAITAAGAITCPDGRPAPQVRIGGQVMTTAEAGAALAAMLPADLEAVAEAVTDAIRRPAADG